MKRLLAPLVFALLAPGEAVAQAPPRLPWDVPFAQAGSQLESAGFQRRAGDPFRIVPRPGGGFQRVARDSAEVSYTRERGGVREVVQLRGRGAESSLMVYSATGDSASLQARLDATATDAAARAGAGAVHGRGQVWQVGAGQRLIVPRRPAFVPGAGYQFTVLYYRS